MLFNKQQADALSTNDRLMLFNERLADALQETTDGNIPYIYRARRVSPQV